MTSSDLGQQRLPQRINITRIELTVAASAGTRIQRVYRGHVIRHTWVFLSRFFLDWVVTVQSITRSRKVRLVYRLVLYGCIVPIQKYLRGYLTRREIKRIRKTRLTAYRAQVFELWRRSYSSLAYRVKFWMFINRYRFLHLSLHEDELVKLWWSLGLKPLEYNPSARDHDIIYSSCFAQMESRLGCKSKAVFHRFLIVQRRLDSVKTDPNKLELHPVFPTEFFLLKDVHVSVKNPKVNLNHKTLALKHARDKLIIEREEIYKTLKTCKRTNPEAWEQLYSSLKIPDSVQQKKKKVVKMLWEHPAYAKTSLQVFFMMESFTNGDMLASRAGTLGRPSSGVTEQYTAKMVKAKDAKLVLQANMRHATNSNSDRIACSSSNPINTASFLRQIKVVTSPMKNLDWTDQRAILIESYLSCDSKAHDFLVSRVASLQQTNRRKRIRNRNRIGLAKAMPSSPSSTSPSPSAIDLQSTRNVSELRYASSQVPQAPPLVPYSSLVTTNTFLSRTAVETTGYATRKTPRDYSKDERSQRLAHVTNGHAETIDSRRIKSVADLQSQPDFIVATPVRAASAVGVSPRGRWLSRLSGSPASSRKVFEVEYLRGHEKG